MDYSSVKNVPFKGYARAYETTQKRLVADNDVREVKVIKFGEFVEDKKDLPDYHDYSIGKYKYVGIIKVTIEPDKE